MQRRPKIRVHAVVMFPASLPGTSFIPQCCSLVRVGCELYRYQPDPLVPVRWQSFLRLASPQPVAPVTQHQRASSAVARHPSKSFQPAKANLGAPVPIGNRPPLHSTATPNRGRSSPRLNSWHRCVPLRHKSRAAPKHHADH
jgi:hypothetical protein